MTAVPAAPTQAPYRARAAGRHGFALGGGNALIAHGIISRPTEDVVMWPVKLSRQELSQTETRSSTDRR